MASAAVPEGSWTSEECRFSYGRFHLYFTLPPTLLLYAVYRPFMTPVDHAKLLFLPAIAFVWTTAWDNELVRQRAWSYPRSCVLGVVGYVPLEEYFFFLIQSVMTTILTACFSRWLLPTLYVARDPSKRRFASFVAVSTCFAAIYTGFTLSKPHQHTYYLGMIAWWCSIPLALLFWGSADYISRTSLAAFLGAVVTPTLYLWSADIFALRRGTWHISEVTSTGIFALPDLPIEEAIFFTVTNLLLVVASYTFDRCLAIARLSGLRYAPSYLPLDWSSVVSLWRTFLAREPTLSMSDSDDDESHAYIRDLRISLDVLSKASRSFSMASLLLPWDLRSDLCILYAFCRAADDCIDEVRDDTLAPSSPALAHHRRRSSSLVSTSRLRLLTDLVGLIYRQDLSHAQVRRQIRETLASRPLDLSAASRENLRASASAVVSLRHLVPKTLWDELLRGYERDLDLDLGGISARLRNLDELVEYAQCVAGCVGEMCVRVVLGRCGESALPSSAELGLKRSCREDDVCPYEAGPSAGYLIYHARRMGVALQLVNVARDVIDDAVKLRRCYLPIDVIVGGDAEALQAALFAGKVATTAEGTYANGHANGSSTPSTPSTPRLRTRTISSPRPISPSTLRPTILSLLSLATHLYTTSFPALSALGAISPPTRSGLRAACSVYFGIADEIRRQGAEEVARGERATMSGWRRARTAARAVYLGRG